jgi:hypothetical protein
MGRAGGWILGAIVVLGMAGAGVLGLRPILFRKNLVVEFVSVDDWKGPPHAGVQLAFEEKGFRADRLKVQPAYMTGQNRSRSPRLMVDRDWYRWEIIVPSSPRKVLRLYAPPSRLGARAADWARTQSLKRVYLINRFPSADSFEGGFRDQATRIGIDCSSPRPQGMSLVEAVLDARAELVIVGRMQGQGVIDALRTSGYSGQVMMSDPDDIVLTGPETFPASAEGVLMVTCFVPIPATFATKQKTTDPNEYYGYATARLVLDAIELAGSEDPEEIFRVLSQSPEFSSDGYSAVAGGLYVVKKGAIQLVELLK